MENEKLLHWISKLVAQKKVGALLLSAVFVAMFIWTLLVEKEGFNFVSLIYDALFGSLFM